MKKLLAVIMIGSALVIAGCSGEVVATRPADVVYERPAAPGADYVWIGGDWVWEGGSYRWHEGRWDRRVEGKTWHEGHWETHGKGYTWHKGHY
jgi:WXXGXW repeat (2 copies)